MNLHETKLRTAIQFRTGARYLSPNLPIQPLVMEDGPLGRTFLTIHVSVLLTEFVVKHQWEIANGRDADKTHEIRRIFEKLPKTDQDAISNIYDRCVNEYHEMILLAREKVDLNKIGDPASLTEALDWNYMAMRDFKYDLKLAKWIPHGTLWMGGTIWTLPAEFTPFGCRLTDWAADQYHKTQG